MHSLLERGAQQHGMLPWLVLTPASVAAMCILQYRVQSYTVHATQGQVRGGLHTSREIDKQGAHPGSRFALFLSLAQRTSPLYRV